MPVASTLSSPTLTLPPELMRLVVKSMHFGACHPTQRLTPDALAFRACRLISHSIKFLVEQLHPKALNDLQNRIAQHYVSTASVGEEICDEQVLKDTSSLDLMARAQSWGPDCWSTFPSETLSGLHRLLRTCTKLEELRWQLRGTRINFGDLAVELLEPLRQLTLGAFLPWQGQYQQGEEWFYQADLSSLGRMESLSILQNPKPALEPVDGEDGDGPHYDGEEDEEPPGVTCPLRELPPNLRFLKLFRMDLHIDDLEDLKLWTLTQLVELDLSFTPGLGEQIGRLRLHELANLKVLRLRKVESVNGDRLAALQLDRLPRLEELDLSDNEIQRPSLLRIGSSTTLKTLTLSGNPLADLDFGFGPHTIIENLVLEDANLDGSLRPVHFQHLSSQLAGNRTLQYLSLAACRLHSEQLQLDVSGWEGLQMLDLSHNFLTEEAVEQLGLDRRVGSLAELRLHGNHQISARFMTEYWMFFD